MAKGRKCLFCGEEYKYCPNCKNYSSYPAWMNIYCSEKCYEIYSALCGYNMGVRTVENVKEVLDKYEFTDYSSLIKYSKDLVNQLNGSNSVQKEEPKVEENIEPTKKENNNYANNNMKKSNKKYNFERRVNTEE